MKTKPLQAHVHIHWTERYSLFWHIFDKYTIQIITLYNKKKWTPTNTVNKIKKNISSLSVSNFNVTKLFKLFHKLELFIVWNKTIAPLSFHLELSLKPNRTTRKETKELLVITSNPQIPLLYLRKKGSDRLRP